MELRVSIEREEDGDMAGKLMVEIKVDNFHHKVYVRDLEQAANEIKNFVICNFEDDGADICWISR